MKKLVHIKKALVAVLTLPMLIHATILPVRCLAQSNLVGTLGGEVVVTPYGTASYDIPIDVAPGTNGMQPHLSISYNSALGRGLAGVGWTIAGLSSIGRTHRNYHFDGEIGSVDFGENDRYVLDGSRLVLLSNGDYNVYGAEYGTETENFLRVTLLGKPFSQAQYFTAVTDGGQIIEYGATTDSKQILSNNGVLSWMVNKITDADGNYMSFTYGQNTERGEIWPLQIDYTGNTAAGLNPYAKVCFQYINDSIRNTSCVGGGFVTTKKLLDKIVVKYSDTIVRQYCMEYDFGRSTRLSAVVLRNASGHELTRTVIRWGNDDTAVSTTTISGLSGDARNLIVLDYDADNIPDLLLSSQSQGEWSWFIMEGDADGNYTQTNYHGSISSSYPLFVIDYDGDGHDDMGYVQHAANSNNYTFKVVKFEQGSTVEIFSQTKQSDRFLTGDFLGRDTTRFVFISNPVGGYCEVTNSINSSSFLIPANSLVTVTDMNGNGKADIQVVSDNYINVYEYNSHSNAFTKILNHLGISHYPKQSFHGDFNGDGLVDYLYYAFKNGAGRWFFRVSKGNGYTSSQELPFDASFSIDSLPNYPVYVSDINGDGKDDFVQPVGHAITKLRVYYTRSYTFAGLLCDTLQMPLSTVTFLGNNSYQFADLNRDGKNELIKTQWYFLQSPVVFNFPERREHDLISSITNGLGTTTALSYGYYNSPKTAGYLGADGKRVRHPLVSKIRRPDGLGGVSVTTLTYDDAVFDHDRQQLLGFQLTNSYLNGTNTKQHFVLDETHHWLGLDQSLTFYQLRDYDDPGGYNDDPLFWNPNRVPYFHYENYNTLSYLDLTNGRFVPYNSVSSTFNRLENTIVQKGICLDATGRMIQSTTLYEKAETENGVRPWVSRDSTRYTYTSVNLPNGKTATKPSRIVTWNKRNGFAQMPSHTTKYHYSSGRLVSVATSDSDGPIDSTSYTYNSFGLPLSETLIPNGLAPRTRSFTYDYRGRFLNLETDALGHTKTTAFDPLTGLVKSEKDVNNLLTSYQYDGLGKLIRVIRPDNTVHYVSYQWCHITGLEDAVFYVRETEAGTPETRTYYDLLGRVVHTYCDGQGYGDIVYDTLGRVTCKTAVPYPSTTSQGPKTWRRFNYDIYGRVTDESAPYTDLSYTYYSAAATQHNYFVTVTDNNLNTSRTRTYDVLGRLMSAQDVGGTVTYTYGYQTIGGKTRDVTTVALGNVVTTIVSDLRGNRISIDDPDAGMVTSTYNALNQLTSRTDANGNQTTYTYDLLGRVLQTVITDGTDTETMSYTYDNAVGKGIGKIASVQHDGDLDCVYNYDNLGRVSKHKVYDGNAHYDHIYEYDTLGRLQTLTYPNGFGIKHTYNGYGELKEISDAYDNSLIYAIDERNKFRQPMKCRFGNNTGTCYTYNSYGMLTGIRNGDLTPSGPIINNEPQPGGDVFYDVGSQYRNLTYTYNDHGFIATKSESNANQAEAYYYDNLDRLTSYKVNGVTAASFTYGNNGNIATNSKVGSYSYGDAGPHAVTGIDGNIACSIPSSQCNVAYNLRNRPSLLTENNYAVTLDYDASGMRRHTVITNGQTLVKERTRFSSLYEEEATATTARRLDYIYAEGRIVAVNVEESGSGSLYYVLTDHLGSWEKVLTENKTVVQQTHFDPWGNRMSYTAWNTPQTQTSFMFDRGFTGHEHYDQLHIINANARLYDPVIGRFFSPDPFVQAPDFSQNFNRYSYCMNNPVMYSDEDGEWVHIVVGAVIGGVSNLIGNWGNCDGFWQYAAAFGAGAASGAVSAALPGWGSLIGGAITGATNSTIAQTGNNFTSNGTFDWSQFGTSCIAGAAAGLAGYGGGLLGAQATNVVIGSLNIVSPVTKGFVGGVLGGGIGGFMGGFAGGLVMSKGNLDAAFSAGLSGAYQGASLGGATGVAGGFYYAQKHDLNPWTGVKKGSVTIGEDMSRVSMAQKQLKNETIKSIWPDDLKGYIRKDARIINPEAMDFNAQWIEFVKEQNAYIYDIGTPNGSPVSSPFYNMEQARTMGYLNLIQVKGIDGKIIWYRNGN